jgi:hypothetical protein
MPEPVPPSLFAQLKEWLSFLDSIWGVAGAVVVTAAFMYRRMSRKQALSSIEIERLSSKLGDIGTVVKTLEADNAKLADQLAQISARDFEYALAALQPATSLSQQHVAVLNLGNCFSLNSQSLSEVALALARIHLEAFYSRGDIAQLKEADRFATIAVLVAPTAVALAVKAQVAMAIASNAPGRDSRRPRDDLWDEALDVLRNSEPTVDDKQRFQALQAAGTRLRNAGHYELAGAALRAAHRIAEGSFGLHSQETLVALNNVATNFNDRGLPGAAKPLFEELADRQHRIAGHFDDQAYRFKLAATACDRQLLGEKRVLARFESLVKDGRERFGRDNRWVLKAQNSLAVCLAAVDRDAEAEALYRDTIERETRVFGSNHENPLSSRANLAAQLVKTGRRDAAIAEMTDVVRRREEMHGADHPVTRKALHQLERMRDDDAASSARESKPSDA